MKMLNKRIVFAVLTFGLIGMSQVALAEVRDLTKDEIITVFSGKTEPPLVCRRLYFLRG